MSREKLVEKGREVRHWRLHRRPNDTLGDLARALNPIVRCWMSYWGRFYRTEMMRGRKKAQDQWNAVVKLRPRLFAQWAWTTAVPRVW